jgi:hypothetical protein
MHGMTFQETMSGPFAMGVSDAAEGARVGQRTDWHLALHLTVTIDDMAAFVEEPRPPARLSGEVELPGVPGRLPISEGTFELFPPSDSGTLMSYTVEFWHQNTHYHLLGRKASGKRPSLRELWSDTTTLDVHLHRNAQFSNGYIAGAGVLRLTPFQLAKCLASIRTARTGSPVDAARTVGGYAWLMGRSLARTYLPGLT